MTDVWLMEAGRLAELTRAREHNTADNDRAVLWVAAEMAREASAVEARELPRIMSVAGHHAEIRIEGVLTKRPDFFAAWFGGGNTTYGAIRHALAVAAAEPDVRSVVLNIDSPGGSVDGLSETLDAIAALRMGSGKALRVRADLAASAAYAIAAAAGPIEAVARGSSFGSIGTAASFALDERVVTLTNTDSPNKRPDLSTDEGKAVVVRYLDQVNDELVRAIARGRGVSAKQVSTSYGRGAMLTAPHALEAGMIDKISSTPPRAVKPKGKPMNSETESGAAPPAASIETVAAAEARGQANERARVLTHLRLGEAAGDLPLALESIRSGADTGAVMTARYHEGILNRTAKAARQLETDAAAVATSGAGASPASTDLNDAIVARMAAEKSFVRG
jgi:ClpP class serine protease